MTTTLKKLPNFCVVLIKMKLLNCKINTSLQKITISLNSLNFSEDFTAISVVRPEHKVLRYQQSVVCQNGNQDFFKQ